MRVAVEAGWIRARNTCLAADSVSLLAAVVLYIFAAGVVKGFAFALGLSHGHRPRGVLLVHQPDGVLAGPVPVLQPGPQALRPRRGEPRPRPAPGRREGLMGKFCTARQRPLHRAQVSIDFVGRKWLWYAISGVIVLARGRSGSTSRASTSASSSRAARSTRVSLPAQRGRPRTTPTSSATPSPAPASRRPQQADRHHLRQEQRSWSQTEPLTPTESNQISTDDPGVRRRHQGRHLHRRDRAELGQGGRQARR